MGEQRRLERGRKQRGGVEIPSPFRDQRQRDVLLQLQQVANILHTAGDPQGGRTITEAIRTNLMRMWAEL